jgi:hypothetical protein
MTSRNENSLQDDDNFSQSSNSSIESPKLILYERKELSPDSDNEGLNLFQSNAISDKAKL